MLSIMARELVCSRAIIYTTRCKAAALRNHRKGSRDVHQQNILCECSLISPPRGRCDEILVRLGHSMLCQQSLRSNGDMTVRSKVLRHKMEKASSYYPVASSLVAKFSIGSASVAGHRSESGGHVAVACPRARLTGSMNCK